MFPLGYRVWDKELKYFDTAPADRDVVIGGDGTIYEKFEDSFGGESFESYRVSDRYEVCWKTGLKDKNGREIYEGDVVSTGYQNCEVVFGWGDDNEQYMYSYGWCLKDLKEPDSEYTTQIVGTHPDNYSSYWEIIGNIYENPDLLGVEGGVV